jgi:hypothetical protein
MGCLFAIFAGGAPRLAFLFLWAARPVMVNLAFNTVIWPLLGLIFLPFTTLMYTVMHTPGVGLVGWDWFWLTLAALLDIGGIASSARANRDRMPGYAA